MNGKLIERLDQYMAYAGLNDNRVTNQCGLSIGAINSARKRGKSLNGDNIEKILYTYKELNARWLLTGEGEMISDISSTEGLEVTSFLKKQNSELMAKIDLLNQEIGELKNELRSMKKGDVQLGMVADNAGADSYGLVK